MAQDSSIEWTTHTFNPWRGCTKVSPGCTNCYADTLSHRNPLTLGVWGPKGTRVVAAESQWRLPLKWNRQAEASYRNWQFAMQSARSEYDAVEPYERPRVFCASLADVFEDWDGPMSDSNGVHLSKIDVRPWTVRVREDEPTVTMQDVRDRLFKLIEQTPNLDWLLLTKRPENVLTMTYDAWCKPVPGHVSQNEGDGRHWHWPKNVWCGVSVENQDAADRRIPILLKVPAAVRFLSCEPLLGAVEFSDVSRRSDAVKQLGKKALDGIHWVIVGGESGPGARPMHPDWARSIRDQCQAAGVAFFFKQFGEWSPDVGRGNETGSGVFLPDGRFVDPYEADSPGWPKGVEVRDLVTLNRIGKKAAGRLLDGREWNEFPEVCS